MSGGSDIAPAHREAIEQFQNLRGWIVGCYSQVEFLMADTIVRAQALPAYDHLPKTPTFNVTKRVRRFRDLIDCPGPISPHAADLRKVVEEWEKAETLRHFLVHGFATFRWTRSGDMMMTFRRYMPDLDIDFDYERRGEVIDRAVSVFEQMHRTLGWIGPADGPIRGQRD